MFWNGSTAMEGLSGSARASFSGSVSGTSELLPAFFPHWPYETETLPRQRLDEALLLAGIADHVPGGIQAGRQRGIGYDTSVPDGVNKVVFANDVLPVADQVFEKVECLWRDGNDVRSAIQLAPVSVECVLLEEIAQAANSSGGLRSSGLQYQLQRKE